MPGGRGRKHFTLVDTTPTSVRTMLLGLDMANQVDQSFVKVHFHKMNVEYANWLVNKVLVKEADMASMRKQFLKDNQDKHEDNTLSSKGETKMTKYLPQMESTNNQRRKD